MFHHRYACRAWPRRYAYAGFSTHMESRRHGHRGHHARGGGAAFGVRRPLRYLSYHLDLDEAQTRKVAAILNRLKTEREQAALDEKRSVARVAELMTGEAPLDEELKVALEPRLASAERLRAEAITAIKALHEVLDEDQRAELSDLLLSGTISL